MSCVVLFTENFSAGLTPYSVLSGNAGVWNVATGLAYGSAMQQVGPSDVSSIVNRGCTAVGTNSYDVKFKVLSAGVQGTGFLFCLDTSGNGPIFVPRASNSNDATQRCGINPGSGMVYFPTVLTIGHWYQVNVRYVPTVGASSAVITDLTAGGTTETILFPGSPPSRDISFIRFTQGASTQQAGVQYSDLNLLNCTVGGDFLATLLDALAAADTIPVPILTVTPAPPVPPPPQSKNAVLSLQYLIPVSQQFKA